MAGPTRKLAAVLAADVAGYSRLVARDEARSLTELRQLRHEILEPAVDRHRGEIVKSMGDGWLVEFGSVADAIDCGIDVQTALSERHSMRLRIGVHAGDIVHEEEDIYGDGVNVAARLQQAAPPGGILISDVARASIDARRGADFAPLGPRSFKNIPSAILVHGWRGKGVSRPGGGEREQWSDAEALVVALARTGDRDAFGQLVRRRQAWVRNLMRRACGDAVLADDLAQLVFLRAWQKIGQLRDLARFDGWLRRLAVNVWLEHLRRTDALRDADPLDDDAPAIAAADGVGFDLDRALARLPGAMRLCVVLAYHEGMTHGEIAESTKLAPGTVKSHIRRGTERLKRMLSSYGQSEPPGAGP